MAELNIYADSVNQQYDLYGETTRPSYAAAPVASPTLAVVLGADSGRTEEVLQDTMARGPAQVASERASLVRKDDVAILKNSIQSLASVNNQAAVEEGLRQLKEAEKIKEPSFFDDVKDSSQEMLERVMITTGKSKEEIISMAQQYSNNIALITALEVATGGLEERSTFTQVAKDLTGLTTITDWTRVSPILNEELSKLGYTGDKALTFQAGVNNFIKTIGQIDAEDRNKVIATIADTLAKRLGEADTRRVLVALRKGIQDSNAEAIFGSIDALMLASLSKAALKGVVNATKPVVLARKLGADEFANKNIADQITNGNNTLKVSTTDAVDSSISARTLLPTELEGASSGVQAELKQRLEKTLNDLENSLYTGGAKPEEIIASKTRLEKIYSSTNNPSIISSKVSSDVDKGKLYIDVLYGDVSGKPFATAEEALNYYKTTKRGDLEVVPIGRTAKETETEIAKVTEEINSINAKLDEVKYAPRMSTSGNVDEIISNSPLYNILPGTTDREATVLGKKLMSVEDAWQNIYRANALPRERFVVDHLVKLLPKQTKILIEKGEGRSYYLPATDALHLYNGEKATNVFTHELIHAITSNRIQYGKLNPNSKLGGVVSRITDLRQAVRKEITSVTDEELKKDLYYLTKDDFEFATSGMWSINQLPKVAVFLNNIKYKNTTLLSELWNSFKELLGFAKKDTALSEWFGLNEELTKQGLRVTIPSEIYTASGKVIPMVNRERIYLPYLPNKRVDDLLSQHEMAYTKLFELKAPPETTGYYVRQKADMPVFKEDIGSIPQSELDKTHLLLGKINPRLASVNSLYSSGLTSMYKKVKEGKLYSDFITSSFNKLNADEINRVNNALLRTEPLKRDMSVFELGEIGVHTDKEVEAYYAFRTMRNMQWHYKNKEAANALISKGYVNLFIGLEDVGKLTGPAKKVDWPDVINKNAYDAENNKFTTITLEKAAELDGLGIQVFEYAKGQSIVGKKGTVTRVLVHPNKATIGDIQSVVGRVDGAYSRVYTEEYFIKIKGPQLVDGNLEQGSYAFRTAISEKEAKAYTEGFNALLNIRKSATLVTDKDVAKQLGSFEKDAKELATRINNGEFDGATATFNYTRLDDNFFRDVSGIGSDIVRDGRVFWSDRSEQGIKSISTGSTDVERLGPLQSLEAEISNTANFVATNEWRSNSIERWFNTFKNVISDVDLRNAKSAEDVFFNVVNNVRGYALSDNKVKEMLATKDFIVSQLGVKTIDEKVIQHAVNSIANNVNVPGFSHVGQVIRRSNIVEWAKSVNSTFMLGMFALDQLAVQASGMLLATTVSPKHGIKAAFSIRPILAALTSDSKSVHNWVHKSFDVAKSTGMKNTEFSEVAAAIKKVGLLDNIGASSVYNGADGSLNIFSRRKQAFNRAQMMFFNKGEEINRVGAFEIARREFIEANPTLKWNTDEALTRIVQRSDDLTMNMSRVNEARITKGTLGIPLQFLQHNIRLGTNLAAQLSAITGKKAPTLSAKEAMQLTLGSYLLYGINNNATPDFIEDWLGKQFNNALSETQKQYLTQGLIAGVISQLGELVTGEKLQLAIGSRLSSLQWYEDLGDAVYDLFKGNKADIKKLAGPTGSTLAALLELPSIFLAHKTKDEFTIQEFTKVLSETTGTLIRSWRNVDKAYWAYHANGMLLNKRGDSLANLSFPELIAQAIGFQSTEAYESGTIFKTKQDYAATMQRFADDVMKLEGQARKAYLSGDIKSMDEYYAAAATVTAPLPEADRQFIKRLTQDRTKYDTVGREAFNKWAVQMSSHKSRLLVTNPYGEPK